MAAAVAAATTDGCSVPTKPPLCCGIVSGATNSFHVKYTRAMFMVMMRNVKSFEYLTRILRITREHCAYIVRDLFLLHAVSVKDSILHCVADRYRFVVYMYIIAVSLPITC